MLILNNGGLETSLGLKTSLGAKHVRDSNRTIDIWGVELRVNFEYAPIVKEKISGPPEQCHPAEGGELEVVDVFIDDWQVTDMLNQSVLAAIKENLQCRVAEIQAEDDEYYRCTNRVL